MDEIKWTREVPLLNNSYMIMDVLFVLLFGAGGLAGILILIMGLNEILAILQIVVLATGILIVLAFLAMGVIMLNNVEMTFTVNEEGIHTTMGKKENRINKLALLMGLMAGKPGLMGSSVLAMSREQSSIGWSDIQKGVMDDRRKVISLSSGVRLLVRLYCIPETYNKAVGYVENMLPDADLKHI